MHFDELIREVRKNSSYYRNLFRGLPECGLHPEMLPVTDHSEFWAGNIFGDDNQVLTGPLREGIVFKSGGTTGRPKFSVYSRREWKIFTEDFGYGLLASGLEAGDRVANLFYSGDLYASFTFINRSLEECPVPLVNFPVGGNIDQDRIIANIMDYQINVMMGVPVSLEMLLHRAEETGKKLPIRKIFFGGEPVFPHQFRYFCRCLKEPLIRSVGHASVDGGQIGYAGMDCGPGEHFSFQKNTWLEILNPETMEVIKEPEVPGKLVLTSYYRTLMPVLRYPVGDMAVWSDYHRRKYRLLGRSEEAFRLGGTTLRWDELTNLPGRGELRDLRHLQVRLANDAGLDKMEVFFTGDLSRSSEAKAALLRSIQEKWPGIGKDMARGLIFPPEAKPVRESQLRRNSRTGKILRIIDERPFPA